MEVTFSKKVKEEITHQHFTNHCLRALISSFICSDFTLVLNHNNKIVRVSSQLSSTIRFIYTSLKKIGIDKMTLVIDESLNNPSKTISYFIDIDHEQYVKNLMLLSIQDFVGVTKNTCCKESFLIGAFLAHGSVNSPNTSFYHLEIITTNNEHAIFLMNLLTKFRIRSNIIEKNKKFMIYVKKSESISDALKIMRAQNSMFEYENVRMVRDVSNQVRRLNTIDMANLKKISKSSGEQIEIIKKYKKSSFFKDSSDKLKIFCEYRLRFPEKSMIQLSNIINSKEKEILTKSNINHIIRKIKKDLGA